MIVLIAALEICSDNKTVAVQCWYIEDAFAGFCQQIFKKNQKAF